MMIRSILQAAESSLAPAEPHQLLTRHTDPARESDLHAVQSVVTDLLATMAYQELCVGLAANQIGERFRVAVVQRPDQEPLVMINPTIVSLTGKKDRKRESCMSVWGLTADVERRSKVAVAYQDDRLNAHEEVFEGFLGRVVQHEIDHLDGVLYTDRATSSPVATDIFQGYTPEAPAAR